MNASRRLPSLVISLMALGVAPLGMSPLGMSPLAARGEDWPRFRGPGGQGVSAEADVPLTWGEGQNVAWKAEVPGAGWSSPVVWGHRLFLTTATEGGASCHVLCFDADTGRLAWDKEVFRQAPGRKEGKNSYATPTPVTDGRHVFAFFAGGGGAALTLDGQVAWVNQDVHFYSKHGLGASPILFEDSLLMPFDGSSSGPDPSVGWTKPWDQAFIAAYDQRTGKERWRARRGLSRQAHVTPMILEVEGKPQLVSGAGDVVQGFDPRGGELIWTVHSRGEGVVPSLVAGGGLVYSSSGFEAETLRAVRPGGHGDITATAIAWEVKRNVPMIPSFLYVEKPADGQTGGLASGAGGGVLFTVKENGRAMCLDAASGKILWEEHLEGNYSASPVLAGGRVYFLAEDGTATVIEAGRQFKVLARNTLGPPDGPCQASPAISGGRIFLRTRGHLYCIGPASATPPPPAPPALTPPAPAPGR